MNERLLQFIWQFQYYHQQQLQTSQGEKLVVNRPGTWNHHQGPDFSAASIRIGNTVWVGNIELHILSSDWLKHRHAGDMHYNNIILHVVWKEDVVIKDQYGHPIPTLVLQNRISKLLLQRYRKVMEAAVAVPCHEFLPALTELGWCAWKERMAAERLEAKAAQVLHYLQTARYHWEEVFWWQLTANFGLKVNAALFEQVSRSIPVNILSKHRNRLFQLEALLLGQANLLHHNLQDAYGRQLWVEYLFLQKKYNLRKVEAQPAFLRMRPASFPTVRLAQLAMLLHNTAHLFTSILEIQELKEALQLFDIAAGAYWNDHYCFDELSENRSKYIGKQMQENIFINTVVPVLFAYGLHANDERYKDKAIQWLYRMSPEQNKITRYWQQAGIGNRSALDSQALLQLNSKYCVNKRCLDCAVGNRILKG